MIQGFYSSHSTHLPNLKFSRGHTRDALQSDQRITLTSVILCEYSGFQNRPESWCIMSISSVIRIVFGQMVRKETVRNRSAFSESLPGKAQNSF